MLILLSLRVVTYSLKQSDKSQAKVGSVLRKLTRLLLVFAAEPRQEYCGSQPRTGVVSLLEKCPVHVRRPVPLHRQQLHRPGQPASVPGGPL